MSWPLQSEWPTIPVIRMTWKCHKVICGEKFKTCCWIMKVHMGSTALPNNSSSISKTRNSTVPFLKLTLRNAVQFPALWRQNVAVSFSFVKHLALVKKNFFWVQEGIQTHYLHANSHWGAVTGEPLTRNSREISSGTQIFFFLYSPSWHTKISSFILFTDLEFTIFYSICNVFLF